jgi:nucleotidyltransferase/DNA polymerase involved in DNA repair
VRAELGLPMSIGVARTKHLAKIASQVAKPDGLVVVDPQTELEFLHQLPVALMWGVGPATEARLAKIGVTTIGQLAASSPQSVERLLGHAVGNKLTSLAWNRDPRHIQTRRRAQSAGAQSALGRQPAIERVFKPTLHHLADRIGARLRAKSLVGRTITVRVRFADLRRSRARGRWQHRFLQRGLSLRSPRTWCAAPLRITVTRGRSRCWRSPSRISKRIRSSNWSCRSGFPAKEPVLARRKAWRDRAQTGPSMRSAIGLAEERWIMGRHRASSAPSLTSSDALLKESCEYRERQM